MKQQVEISKHQEFENKLNELQNVINNQNYQISDLSSKLNETLQMFQLIQNENNVLKNENNQLKHIVNEEKQKYDYLLIELQNSFTDKEQLKNLQDRIHELTEKLENKSINEQKYFERIEKYKNEIKQLQDVNKDNLFKIIDLNKEIDNIQINSDKKIDVMNKKIVSLKKIEHEYNLLINKMEKEKVKKKTLDKLVQDKEKFSQSIKKYEEEKNEQNMNSLIDSVNNSNKKLQQIVDENKMYDENEIVEQIDDIYKFPQNFNVQELKHHSLDKKFVYNNLFDFLFKNVFKKLNGDLIKNSKNLEERKKKILWSFQTIDSIKPNL